MRRTNLILEDKTNQQKKQNQKIINKLKKKISLILKNYHEINQINRNKSDFQIHELFLKMKMKSITEKKKL